MEILLFRATLAPSLVLLVSVAARRLGPRAGGQLLGAPTTTGPFLALMCMTSGTGAAAQATHGSATGQLAVSVFTLAYGRLAPHLRPTLTLLSTLGCAAVAGVVGAWCPSIWLTAALVLAVILAGLMTWPAAEPAAQPEQLARAREILLRMLLAGATMLAAMAVSVRVGSFVGGVLSSLPVLLAVIGPSLHRSAGPTAAATMMRGALAGASGTMAFLLVLSTTLVPQGPRAAFLLALAAMILPASMLRWLRPVRPSPDTSAPPPLPLSAERTPPQ
ncbi:hypothetical protein ACIQPS_33395 [Streptomyces sp. NPDC091290]|uniref:hypothetical protein n=1 Tax=Streptomyces sp. NPDC091290 TaxID=3365990 RepID=UPI0037F8E91F